MPRRPPSIDRTRVRTQPARRRPSKVKTRDEARPVAEGASVADLLASMPDLLGAADLNAAIDAWARAWHRDRLVLFGFGAHLIKTGLAPIVVDLLERGAIGALMMGTASDWLGLQTPVAVGAGLCVLAYVWALRRKRYIAEGLSQGA